MKMRKETMIELAHGILWASVMIGSSIVLKDTPGAMAKLLPILCAGAGASTILTSQGRSCERRAVAPERETA